MTSFKQFKLFISCYCNNARLKFGDDFGSMWLLLGSPMPVNPHPSQQHAGIQLQHEVTRPQGKVLNLPGSRNLRWRGG